MDHAVIATLTAIWLSAQSLPDRPEPWYLSAVSVCSDPFSLVTVYSSAGYFQPSFVAKAPNISQGKIYLEVPNQQFRSMLAAEKSAKIETHVLSGSDAEALRKIMKAKTETATVPVLTQSAVGLLLSFTLPPFTGSIAGTLFGLLFDALNSRAVSARVIEEVLAAGGTLSRVHTARETDKNREVVIRTFQYDVSIGTERRFYVTSSCIYPARVIYDEFRILETKFNPKIIKRITGDKWRTFDVDTNKFEGDEMTEVGRDDEFVYLSTGDSDGFGEYRVSVRRGPYQKFSGGKWATLYPKVDPR